LGKKLYDYQVCPDCGVILIEQLAHEHTCAHLLSDHDLGGDHEVDPVISIEGFNAPQVEFCEQCERYNFRFDMMSDDLCDECTFENAGLLPLDEASRQSLKKHIQDWLAEFDWDDRENLSKFYIDALGDHRSEENSSEGIDREALTRFEDQMVIPRKDSEAALLEIFLQGDSTKESRTIAKYLDVLFDSWDEDIDVKKANDALQKMNFTDRAIILGFVFQGSLKTELARNLDSTYEHVEAVIENFTRDITA
jgi:hypothetical protein